MKAPFLKLSLLVCRHVELLDCFPAPCQHPIMPFIALTLPNAIAHVDVSLSDRVLNAIGNAHYESSYDAALALLNRIAAHECLTLTEVTDPVTFETRVIIVRQ